MSNKPAKRMSIRSIMILLLIIIMIIAGKKVYDIFSSFDSRKFNEYNFDYDKFMIHLPKKPMVVERVSEIDNLKMIIYSTDTRSISYDIAFIDYPDEKVDSPEKINKLLNDSVRVTVKNLKESKLIEKKDIMLDKYPGKHYVIEGKVYGIFNATIICNTYVSGNRLFQVMATTDKLEKNEERINTYLDSFKIVE